MHDDSFTTRRRSVIGGPCGGIRARAAELADRVVLVRTVIDFSLDWELQRHRRMRHAAAASEAAAP
jgi:hypothetical protein